MNIVKEICAKKRLGMLVLLITIAAVLSGCGSSRTLDNEMERQMFASEIIKQDNIDSESLMGSEKCGYIRLDEKNYIEMDNTLGISKWITEKQFSNLAGLLMAYTADDVPGFVPVYAVCIDDENDLLRDEEAAELYLLDNIGEESINPEQVKAYYIFYSRENDDAVTELGVGMIASDIEWTSRNVKINKGESIDLFESTFEFYACSGIELEEYDYAITTTMNEDDYEFSNYSASMQVLDDVPEWYIQNEPDMESLDNGKEWIGRKISSDKDNPVKIMPFVTLHMYKGAENINEICFSIKGLTLKKSFLKKYKLSHEAVLVARYRNHRFVGLD